MLNTATNQCKTKTAKVMKTRKNNSSHNGFISNCLSVYFHSPITEATHSHGNHSDIMHLNTFFLKLSSDIRDLFENERIRSVRHEKCTVILLAMGRWNSVEGVSHFPYTTKTFVSWICEKGWKVTSWVKFCNNKLSFLKKNSFLKIEHFCWTAVMYKYKLQI